MQKVLKTKKDIFDWWSITGNQKFNNVNYINDKKSFVLDKSINVSEQKGLCNNKKIIIMTLTKKGWKHPLELFWFKNECIKIAY